MVKAGGPDMPPKTNPYDTTTPDGSIPIFIPLSLWEFAKEQGIDVRWYTVPKMIPITGA